VVRRLLSSHAGRTGGFSWPSLWITAVAANPYRVPKVANCRWRSFSAEKSGAARTALVRRPTSDLLGTSLTLLRGGSLSSRCADNEQPKVPRGGMKRAQESAFDQVRASPVGVHSESCPSIQDPALGSDGALPGLQLARSWRWRASLQPRFDSPVQRMARRRRCLLSR
jgi:hypothetical protein